MFHVKRSLHNPIISPVLENPWENSAVFNWCPVQTEKGIEVVYRAVSEKKNVDGHEINMSVVGHALSPDGIEFKERKELIFPEMDWEKFGCEDPRITKIDDRYYIFYTALSVYPFCAEGIKVALAVSRNLEKIDEKYLVTPFNAKAMSLFPEKVNGKFTAVLTVNTDNPPSKICIVQFEKESDMWSLDYWNKFYGEADNFRIELKRCDTDHVEIGAPPVKTKDGWLFIYSHIQNYFDEKRRVFGIEAFLTDLDDPKKIIKRTTEAFLIPETNYELYGQVDNIVFPTGTLIVDGKLRIFYGAADTTCAFAEVELDLLLDAMDKERTKEKVKRYEKNPIMVPDPETPWRAKAIFNPAALDLKGKIHILYRAMSEDNTSYVGYASTMDGFHITENLPDPIYSPRLHFEEKLIPGGNSGCEDPRAVQIGDSVYLFYTAYNGIDSPKVAISHISVEDFLNHRWDWTEPIIVSPEKEWDKDACVIPEKINGRYFMIHRLNSSICADYMDSLDFSQKRVQEYIKLMSPREGMWDSFRIGLSIPPIKTEKGWLLFYHGVNDGVYKLGAAMLDLENPENVIARTSYHIMEPEMEYELKGQVNRVVFPCGAVVRDGIIFIYYGGADSVLCVATIKMEDVLKMLE
jgi:beta-1,2-mannobiose phosphorylase / 1,2-beta-oligomannan phosphorylase